MPLVQRRSPARWTQLLSLTNATEHHSNSVFVRSHLLTPLCGDGGNPSGHPTPPLSEKAGNADQLSIARLRNVAASMPRSEEGPWCPFGPRDLAAELDSTRLQHSLSLNLFLKEVETPASC